MIGQCGGIGWTGPTTCAQGTCKVSNDYYSEFFVLRSRVKIAEVRLSRPMRTLNQKMFRFSNGFFYGSP